MLETIPEWGQTACLVGNDLCGLPPSARRATYLLSPHSGMVSYRVAKDMDCLLGTKIRLWRVDRSGLVKQVKRRPLKQVLGCG
jgi:hypothetical protein